MGSDAFLYKGDRGIMYCICPKCGETVLVYPEDVSGTTIDGAMKYFVRCDECGNWFNASTDF